MTTTLVWTGVALWFGFNVAIAARGLYAMRPVKAAAPARIIPLRHRRG
ncbi:hypothetical protein LPJ38_30565 [Bradyrhizobium daqingense]|uniref:Uncharacterized protein n=1 Tax=Bradyrhizobium daqingense TaxID=993502 RepID=A0A562LPR3_9BRAD|nr:hypothetical protein [Bradyrhizobium daqingense]TWI09607.1 hypothetical protein IQ17_00684 [Bradyrhizobium daqingense]UFS87937.1 hypothetical protein LPJ38_30565 [Bradyrhizobium daqingense]